MRLVWFWGSLALGVGAFVGMILFTVNSHDADPVRDFSIGAATALAFGAYGACCLRWGIVADESGIQLTNTFRRHRIAWSDVEAMELEEIRAEVSIGFHRLVFVTRQKGRIAADAPTGLAEPGRKMFELWQTLSAMWLSYVEDGRESEAVKRTERARLAGGFVGDPIDAVGQESHDAEWVGRPSDALLAGDEYLGPPACDVEEPSNGDMPASGEEVTRRPWWPFVPWSAASATAFVALTIVCNVAEARAALTSLNLLLDDGIFPDRYVPTPFMVQGAVWTVLEILSMLAVVPFVVWLRAVKSSNRVEPKRSDSSEMTMDELWRAARTGRAHRQGTDAPPGRAVLATAWWVCLVIWILSAWNWGSSFETSDDFDGLAHHLGAYAAWCGTGAALGLVTIAFIVRIMGLTRIR
jgi:hypothetical protein